MQLKNLDDEEMQTREELVKRSRKKSRKSGKAVVFCVMIGCIAVLAAMTYGGLKYLEYLSEKAVERQSGGVPGETLAVGGNSVVQDGTGADGADVPAISGSAVYSQEELDAMIAQAVQNADKAEADRILNSIRESLSEGASTIEALRPLYPNDLIVVSGGAFHFVPLNFDLQMNDYDEANLNILDSGEKQYLTDGQVTSHKGIDVSSHQGQIDWKLVAQDGVEFAMIRAGFRGYGKEGKLVEDTRFDENVQGAISAGVKVGVYFFTQAVTEAEADEEAELILSKIAPYRIQCPVVLDVEKVGDAQGRMNLISVEERTAVALRFCQRIEDAGYKVMIYHNTEMGALLIDIAAFEKYDKWYASYSDSMFYPYAYKIWQYSDKGKVQGISTNVDLDLCFEPMWEE